MDLSTANAYDPGKRMLGNLQDLQQSDAAIRQQMDTQGQRNALATLTPEQFNADSSGDTLPAGSPVQPGGYVPPVSAATEGPVNSATAPASGANSNAIMVSEANRRLQAMKNSQATAGAAVNANKSGMVDNNGDPYTHLWHADGSDDPNYKPVENPISTALGFIPKTLISAPGYGLNKNTPASPVDAEQARLKRLQAQDSGAGTPAPTTGSNGSVADRNNNPGNLVYAGQPGATPSPTVNPDGTRFAVFQTPEAGAQAAEAQLQKYIARGNNTLAGIIHTWAGSQYQGNSPASEQAYVANVAKTVGIDPHAPIPADKVPVLAQAMFKQEGGSKGQTAQAPASSQPQQPQMAQAPAAPQTPGQTFSAQPGNNYDYTGQQAEMALQALGRQYAMAKVKAENSSNPADIMAAKTQMDQLAGQAQQLHGQILSGHAYKAQQDVAAGSMQAFGSLVQLASQMRGTPLAIHQTADGQYGLFDAQGKPYGPAGAPVDIARFIYAQTPAGQAIAMKNATDFNTAYNTSAGKAAGESGKELALENLKGQNEVQNALVTGQMSLLLEQYKQRGMKLEPSPMGGYMVYAPDRSVFAYVPPDTGQNTVGLNLKQGIIPAQATLAQK